MAKLSEKEWVDFIEALKSSGEEKPIIQRFKEITANRLSLLVSSVVFPKIRILDLKHNCLGSSGAILLAEALRHHACIQDLNLRGNFILNEGAVAIAEALIGSSSLTRLSLASNNIEEAGAMAIARALKKYPRLEFLSLAFNPIGEDGAKSIAESLLHNQILRGISWPGTVFVKNEGEAAFNESLFSNFSLFKFRGTCDENRYRLLKRNEKLSPFIELLYLLMNGCVERTAYEEINLIRALDTLRRSYPNLLDEVTDYVNWFSDLKRFESDLMKIESVLRSQLSPEDFVTFQTYGPSPKAILSLFRARKFEEQHGVEGDRAVCTVLDEIFTTIPFKHPAYAKAIGYIMDLFQGEIAKCMSLTSLDKRNRMYLFMYVYYGAYLAYLKLDKKYYPSCVLERVHDFISENDLRGSAEERADFSNELPEKLQAYIAMNVVNGQDPLLFEGCKVGEKAWREMAWENALSIDSPVCIFKVR